ncbi:MAG: LTA synthase family protein [Bacilli bacterium]|nr:LTA synthase family protein [Bacilli bacterium]
MKKYMNKNVLLNFLINFILLFILEVIFKLVNFFNIIDWSSIRIIIGIIIISFVISSLEYLIPKKLHKYINIIFIFICSIYSLLQTAFNNYIGVYMSLGTSSQLTRVIDYVREFILSFKWYYYFNLLPFILILIYYIFINKKIINKFNISNNKNNYKKLDKKIFIKKVLVYFIFLTMMSSLYSMTLFMPFMQNKLQTISNDKLFINPSVPSISIKQFGITTYGLLDIKNYFFPIEVIEEYNIENMNKDNLNENIKRTFDDKKWISVIENETNNKYNTLNNYFINNNITDINEYTGLFEDKNLIVIMLESVNDIIINEKDYPNFYKMYNNGMKWVNNYSPRNSCSTGNNEMSGMISLYSIYNTCTANIYKENTYFNSIFNLFNNKNYYTFSAHNYTEHYYYRNDIHTNMGSKKYYGVEELGIDYSNQYKNWSSDEDFMTKVLDILGAIDLDTKFMTWLTTVSSHQPYYYSSKEGDMYLDLYDDLDISKDLKRYKSKLKILDNALGILLTGLEEKGILDDTVIVMFGDHYPYGLSTETINTVLDYDTEKDYEAERVPFVIYNSEIESKTFHEYTSYINILPTIANLFNLNYDPRLYMGTDLLSEDYESLVIFADGSWKNENAYYNASSGEIEYYKDFEYSLDEIKEINQKIELKIQMSSLAIKNNYFNYLYNKLSDKEQSINTNMTKNDIEES